MWQDLPIGQKRRTFAERVPNLPKHGTHDMTTIHLPHPVLAHAAAAMETAMHFELVDIELQSYCIQPVATGFALIGRHGEDLRASPAAAYISWDDAHYIGVVHDEIQLVYIYDVTTNIVCSRIGDHDTASVMSPILRGSRTAYKPTGSQLGAFLRDTVFETEEMRAARHAAFIAELEEEDFDVDFCDESCPHCMNEEGEARLSV